MPLGPKGDGFALLSLTVLVAAFLVVRFTVI